MCRWKLLIVVGLLATSVAMGKEDTIKNSTKQQQSSQVPGQAHAEAPMLVVQEIAAPNGATSAAYDKMKEDTDEKLVEYTKELASYTLWLMWATSALAILGLIQLGFLTKADKTASKSAIAASVAAGAAKKAAEVAEQAMISDRRPWVHISRMEQTAPAHRDIGVLRTRVIFKNLGSSPALNIYGSYQLFTLTSPSNQDIQNAIDRGRIPNNSSGISLMPTDDDSMGLTLRIAELPDGPVRIDSGYLLYCFYYTFPLQASKSDGYTVCVFRITKQEDASGGISFDFEKFYSHAD